MVDPTVDHAATSRGSGDRVTIFVDRFLPPSQAFVIQQASALKRHRPEFLTFGRAGSRLSGIDDYPVRNLRDSRLGQAAGLLLKAPRLAPAALWSGLGGTRLLHAHFGKNGYILGPLARTLDVPLVTTFHGFDATYAGDPAGPGGFNQTRFFRTGRAAMARGKGFSIAVSGFIRERLLAMGFDERRIFQHYIGIDTKLFAPQPQVARRKARVVSVARFVEYKGHRYIIDALAKVAAAGVSVELVMIGQGPLRDEIEQLARRRLPDVTLMENLSQQEIRDVVASARVYVHGSVTLENGHAEAMGLANLEALGVGTPVVAFDSGGVGEAMRPGVTGFTVPERDTDAMADAIGRLLTDDDLWAASSQAATAFVAENFDIQVQSRLLEDYYDAVADQFSAESK